MRTSDHVAAHGTEHDRVELSRRGRVWSYTDARYQPPPPYVPATDPYVASYGERVRFRFMNEGTMKEIEAKRAQLERY